MSSDLENPRPDPDLTAAPEETEQPALPLIFVPVEAADVVRKRRLRNTVIGIVVVVLVGSGTFIYKHNVDPIKAQQSFDAGMRLLKIARYSQAILAFDRAASLKPDFADAYLMRGRALMGDNHTEPASRDFTKVIELRPNDPHPLVERGRAYIEMHDYQAAIDDANRAIEMDKGLAVAYNLRGTAVRSMGNLPAALKDFDRAVQLDPMELNYFERAATYQLLGDHQKAIADLTELIAFRPDFAPGYFARAKSLRAIGDFKGAQRDHDAGRALDGR